MALSLGEVWLFTASCEAEEVVVVVMVVWNGKGTIGAYRDLGSWLARSRSTHTFAEKIKRNTGALFLLRHNLHGCCAIRTKD